MNILLVDASPNMLSFLEKLLSAPGRVLQHAKSFEECQNIVNSTHIDLVITGFHLPSQNGFAVANMVHENSPDVPVFLVTGCHDEDDMRFAHLAGFEKIFAKPVRSADLKEAIIAAESGVHQTPIA